MQTFTKRLNFLSVGSSVQTDDILIDGTVNNAMGQTSVTDATVPVGSKVKAVRINYGFGNVGATAIEVNVILQYAENAQAFVNPNSQGTSAQRANILRSWHFTIAPDQQLGMNEWVKIPKQWHRAKENRRWALSVNSNAARTQSGLVVYKVRN